MPPSLEMRPVLKLLRTILLLLLNQLKGLSPHRPRILFPETVPEQQVTSPAKSHCLFWKIFGFVIPVSNRFHSTCILFFGTHAVSDIDSRE